MGSEKERGNVLLGRGLLRCGTRRVDESCPARRHVKALRSVHETYDVQAGSGTHEDCGYAVTFAFEAIMVEGDNGYYS